ncbi:serine/threonine-protein kinase CTR1-like isoform X1 [Abrus precatorius]|uniref:non-specific serine/threonine protein kinase n=1 Tax=Abrus precatorius TaxID=3816 RepID=A0A8B8MCD5_ABRPR|nr:serine/threonine-protein kinase CTR1-like isoform X1 [Abrus precatorius]XP_027366228.1 serine/threonine-protein kinase CTR1-like isoform X1 [Abrus precatorius]XP_027366229.1 serine/threonine-protein kinase CTR1-like isoform X1 [Abrus precatorius]XP_027366230.1 serine/threonine-protein kinase CTR1-like isoform X1 [Abrus precatorius]XP_027366231.1 serine/threonine-protein kinase CTR1-like isoform X1 [Abrus precatorius]XP_027366232.1 serine/threonine-protein kinase CTR1-like isoform X1 [Abrus 
MEMPARRSNYSLLSQIPDDQFSGSIGPPPPSSSGDGKTGRPGKLDRAFDWDLVADHRAAQQGNNRIGNLYSSIGLQRQSSGSSYGESSLSGGGEYYAPTLSTAAASEVDAFGYLHDEGFKISEVRSKFSEAPPRTASSSGKSWAQQTEESYQLQLALALRLSSDATCADDPNFLDPLPDDSALRRSSTAEAVSHRFWVNGCVSYSDKIPDGFYLIHGMDSYVWTVCTDLQESGRIPSVDILKSVNPCIVSSLEVVLVDRCSDPSLRELQNRVHGISCSSITPTDVVDHLSKLVCNRMGGSASVGEDDFVSIWRDCSNDLKDCLGSVVIPIGSLSLGLCRHRAILFKVLADAIDLPCRIAKGCKYCKRDDATSCVVRFGLEREYLVDLIGKPGNLSEPDSLLNGPSSISFSSPLRFPRLKPAEPTIDFRSLAKQYFSDCMSLELVFDNSSAELFDGKCKDRINPRPISTDSNRVSHLPLHPQDSHSSTQDQGSEAYVSCNPPQNIGDMTTVGKYPPPIKHKRPVGIQTPLALTSSNDDIIEGRRFVEGSQLIPNKSTRELALDMEDLDIPWSDLILREKIGSGSFGTVHRAEWNGSDVAVKILMEQDFHAERFKEFLREVAIMKRLRHPNIVLFMGAVTQPPNLSIVTEYLSRGSLYRLLHRSGAKEGLDERRRLGMAYDVAKGMNYLHKRNPPIVHRDLKSPNLLVDKKYTVKVCDFGLSRLKANTFLSSKSAAGTPEWMAPEVLRDEPSNEKSDVYSFGVILWELATLQQPWINLNPAQVVAAVGFKGKRLEIPHDINPQVAALIDACWANEPWKRPSFANIMDSLRSLLKPPTPQPGRPNMPL